MSRSTAIATALNTVDPASIPAKAPRISKRVSEAVRLLVTGECTTQRAAAERVGLTASHLCEVLKKPNVQVFVARECRQTIARGSMRATARLLELVDASSEHVSLDATKHALALNGIKPANDPQVSVSIELKAGYVIDLTDKQGPMVDVQQGVVSD